MSDFWPKLWVTIIVWATDDIIEQTPDLVRRFVKATLETVKYLRENPGCAAELYAKRTNAPKDLAGKVVAQFDWAPSGRGSGQDLLAAVFGQIQYNKDSKALPPNFDVKVEDVVDIRFLP